MKKSKRNRVIALILLAVLISLFIIDWIFYAGGLKRIYYFHFKYDKDKIRVLEEKDFPFYKVGFSKSYTLNSSYYVPHRLLLIPESKSVPVQYEFGGEILVEIYDKKDVLLHSFTVDKPINIYRKEKEDYYGNYMIYCGGQRRDSSSIFAFELGEISFNIIRFKWDRLKNMVIKVTVIKPDENLKEYCDSATLVIIPDLQK